VTSATWFGRDLYRYYDRQFPYVLVLSFPAGRHEGAELHLHMLLAAPMRR
jgi:hypothetical protein